MSQISVMLLIALLVGVFFAGSTWVAVDLIHAFYRRWAVRREQRRLEAEARALAEAEAATDVEDE